MLISRTAILFLLLTPLHLAGCTAGAVPSQTSPVVRTDTKGTKPIEALDKAAFCGARERLFAYHGAILDRLRSAWSKAGGVSTEKCTVTIAIDLRGNIVGHDATECDNRQRLMAALEQASPVPRPESRCFQEELADVSFGL